MAKNADLEQRIERIEEMLSMDPGPVPIVLTDESWIRGCKTVKTLGSSKGILLTEELKRAGYDEGDSVIVMILRKSADPFFIQEGSE